MPVLEQYQNVPENTLWSIRQYVDHGQPIGHFLLAVLSNDLKESVAYADEDNMAELGNIVKLIMNHVPAACQGSKAKVDEWLASGGLRGKRVDTGNFLAQFREKFGV